jgi:hypothetical protein
MYTVGPGIWRENLKIWKIRHTHCRTWNMVRDLKMRKMRNSHCRMWNMARNSEKPENCEIHTVGNGIWQEN